jgi:hypothetical protein
LPVASASLGWTYPAPTGLINASGKCRGRRVDGVKRWRTMLLAQPPRAGGGGLGDCLRVGPSVAAEALSIRGLSLGRDDPVFYGRVYVRRRCRCRCRHCVPVPPSATVLPSLLQVCGRRRCTAGWACYSRACRCESIVEPITAFLMAQWPRFLRRTHNTCILLARGSLGKAQSWNCPRLTVPTEHRFDSVRAEGLGGFRVRGRQTGLHSNSSTATTTGPNSSSSSNSSTSACRKPTA